MRNDKIFIENLISKGIEEFGEDFWLDNTEDRLECWDEEINISEFIDDTGCDCVWINPDSRPNYNREDIEIFEGEATCDGDWFITKIVDDLNNIVAIYATMD